MTRSLASSSHCRASGPEKSGSVSDTDFFNTIDPERKSGLIDTLTAPQYNQRHCVLQGQTHRMAEERVQRRLAAILAADVAGFSRSMGVDEEGTLAQLKTHRRDLLDPKINEYQGRIVKTVGDGILVEFAGVVDALRCAIDIQHA